MVKKFEIPFTNIREDRLISQLLLRDIKLPEDFKPDNSQTNFVVFQPGGWGGRHMHLRKEVFVGFGEGLYLIWIDVEGNRREEKMDQHGKTITAFAVGSLTQHLIENRLRHSSGLLLEFADSPQVNVIPAPDL